MYPNRYALALKSFLYKYFGANVYICIYIYIDIYMYTIWAHAPVGEGTEFQVRRCVGERVRSLAVPSFLHVDTCSGAESTRPFRALSP